MDTQREQLARIIYQEQTSLYWDDLPAGQREYWRKLADQTLGYIHYLPKPVPVMVWATHHGGFSMGDGVGTAVYLGTTGGDGELVAWFRNQKDAIQYVKEHPPQSAGYKWDENYGGAWVRA